MTVPMCQTRDLLRAQLLSRLSAPCTPRAPVCVGNLPGSADCWAFPSPASSSTRPMLLGWEQPGTRESCCCASCWQAAQTLQALASAWRWGVAVLMSDGFYGLDVEATISTGPQGGYRMHRQTRLTLMLGTWGQRIRGTRRMVLALTACILVLGNVCAAAPPQPAGEMRWALYVTLSPAWFDPAEVAVAGVTPFWVLYALHDALVKPMPGNPMAPSLAESWTVSTDQRVYEFKLREGVKFHNGDPFTAEDVKFSFLRYKWPKEQSGKVREVEIVDPFRIRFHLQEPWPDFMTYYGTLATGAAWVVPKKYVERVGGDGLRQHPIGLGPYKFVSHTPGVELVMEAYEGYWRQMPHVKRLVFKSVPDSTTRMAMLKRGEVDVAYLLTVPLAEEAQRDPKLKVAFSGGIGVGWLHFLEQWNPKSPWHDQRVRLAANYALDRQALSEAETLGASKLTGSMAPRHFEFTLPLEPYPYDPVKARQLLAEAGYPNGFDGGDLTPVPPYFDLSEAIANYLGAVGIKVKPQTMERAAFFAALNAKQLRGLCMCGSGRYGNAATRLEEAVLSTGTMAYGGYPDLDALFKQQDSETDHSKREALLHQIQQLVHERVMFGPIWEYIWPSGIGPRVEEPGLMLINPYPWSAPLEEVRLKPE